MTNYLLEKQKKNFLLTIKVKSFNFITYTETSTYFWMSSNSERKLN